MKMGPIKGCDDIGILDTIKRKGGRKSKDC